MSTNNDNDDQVADVTRDENARVRTDLMRAVLGADLVERTGRMNRGGSVSAKNEILQKQKEAHRVIVWVNNGALHG